MAINRVAVACLLTTLVLAMPGCSASSGTVADPPPDSPSPTVAATTATPRTAPSDAPTTDADVPAEETSPGPTKPAPRKSAPRETGPAMMSIPSLGVHGLRVVAYAGSADDRPGTRIQDGGVAASPRGPDGGVGPGQVGNYIVTAHRTSAGAPFGELPSVRRGEHILVRSGGSVYDYVVTRTMTISFRSERSKARQSAPVPGHPGRPAKRPMITLSTCATPEDHARGNYWSDEFGNPEHRIDKVGVLVDVRPA